MATEQDKNPAGFDVQSVFAAAQDGAAPAAPTPSDSIVVDENTLKYINIARESRGEKPLTAADLANTQDGSTPATTTPQATTSADKFKNPETGELDYAKLLKSYKELQAANSRTAWELSNLRKGITTPAANATIATPAEADNAPVIHPELSDEHRKEAEESDSIAGISLVTLAEQVASSGDIPADARQKLVAAGVKPEVIDFYVNDAKNQVKVAQAEQASYEKELLDSVGGAQQYADYVKFAQQNLPQEYIEAFNEAVSSGNKNQAKLAITGLKNAYQLHYGTTKTPGANMLKGEPASNAVSVDIFKSREEYDLALSSANTPEKVKKVMEKLTNTHRVNKSF